MATTKLLEIGDLAAAAGVLARACAYDEAATVAEEKLFGAGPNGLVPTAWGAYAGNDLVGVAAVCGNRIRVLAVETCSRRAGAGSALLGACEAAARANGATSLRTLDQAGNYLAPGVDTANRTTITWLERRGYVRNPDERTNVVIRVRDNPKVTQDRVDALAAELRAKGYEVRRARVDETALLDAVATEFGGAWPFELARALTFDPPGVHVVLRDGAYCAFAAHDGNNRGLGWFGPTGTWPAHRGNRLGEMTLLACLVDVARDRDVCEVAWIGPRPFYEKVAGIERDRHFVLLAKPL